jgi:hypothetical protein
VSRKREIGGVVGTGAAACGVCGAGPIAAMLAAGGFTAAVGFALLGVVGLAIAVLATLVIIPRRRETATACATHAGAPTAVTFRRMTLGSKSRSTDAAPRGA